MTMEERLQTLFQILNNGDPLTAETVTEVIRAVRPETEDLDQIRMIAAQMPASLSCLGEQSNYLLPITVCLEYWVVQLVCLFVQ